MTGFEMTVYGTKITSDIEIPLELEQKTEIRHTLDLHAKAPASLKNRLRCGFQFLFAHGRKVYLYSDREFARSVKGQPWCYEVQGVAKFYWYSGEREVYYELGEEGNAELLGFWLVHLFLPLYLAFEEIYDFFHAGAVEIDNKPILFIAPSMGGKSTMTDYFIKQGHTLVSDDKVPTFIDEGKFMAVGSHPYHRPYRKLEELGYRVKVFSSSFKPIHAFYILQSVDENAEVGIEEIKGYLKFDLLLPNYLFKFPFLKTQRLKYLASLLNQVKVFRVNVPWQKERLPEVYEAICQHSRSQR
jgi:hypothetical protein